MLFFDRKEARWAIGLVALFLLSLFIWLLQPQRFDRRVLTFPNHYISGTGAEYRYLPIQTTREASIELFVREYILGPASNRLFRLFPLATRPRSIFFAASVLYVDLDFRSLRSDVELRTGLSEAVEIFRQGILANFSEVHEVVVTIEGREPDFEAVESAE